MSVSHNCPRGSVWRKWDLHIHAPGTKKNDQYALPGGSALDAFCDRLQASAVAAFGITDYFSSDSYFTVTRRFREKYPDSAKVFFPNIELCSSDVVNAKNEEVNLHLVFNPFDAGYVYTLTLRAPALRRHKSSRQRFNIRKSPLKVARRAYTFRSASSNTHSHL